jgi:hypothetical protein
MLTAIGRLWHGGSRSQCAHVGARPSSVRYRIGGNVCLIRGRKAWFLALSHVVLCAHGRRVDYQKSVPKRAMCDGSTYAARFWALRLLCAGVRFSFSSLLLRVLLAWPSSRSAPIPESTLPTGMGVCTAALSGEPCCEVDKPLVNAKASYDVG